MQTNKTLDFSRIAQDLQIRKVQVENVVQLLDEGNTIPFITRYRKERTGGLDEEVIRQIQTRIQLQRQLADRKTTILKSIENQGKLTEDLREAILGADTTKRLEDLYLPYKPKKRTLATTAREKGLEPLALAIWNRDAAVANIDEIAATMVDAEKELPSVEEVKKGVKHILAEMVSETADVRAVTRFAIWDTGSIKAEKNEKTPANKGLIFKDYFQFTEPLRKIPPHRILALNRGEREGVLKVKLDWNMDKVRDDALRALADFCLKQAETGQFATPAGQVTHESAKPTSTPEPTEEPGQHSQGSELTPPSEDSSVGEVPPQNKETMPPGDATTITEESNPSQESQTSEHAAQVSETSSAGDNASAMEPVQSQEPTPSYPDKADSPPAPLPPPFEVIAEGELLSPGSPFKSPHTSFLKEAVEDSLQRLVLPSLEREIRRELMEEAQVHAARVFARNLRSLLLQRPVHHKRILAVDPAFRTGCKIAALDEYGNLLEHSIVYPFPVLNKGKKKGQQGKKGDQHAPTSESNTSSPGEDSTSSARPPESQPAETQTAPVQTGENAVATETPPESMEHATMPAGEEATATDTTSAEHSSEPQTSGEGHTQEMGQHDQEAGSEGESSKTDGRAEAKAKVVELIQRYKLDVAAIGNGTACRETEEFIAELIAEQLPEFKYTVVNEAGASVYSASNIGREEFPDFDATLRSAISIGRRLQDPLAELVKIDPPSLGVGLYQHDVNPKQLKESLDGVVETAVNLVGVDVNTASVSLLRYVAGLNQLIARAIVDYRTHNGPFRNREQFLNVPGMGQSRFTQAAGFLKIHDGENPLDVTWIHPESYGLTEKMLGQLGLSMENLKDQNTREEVQGKLRSISPVELAKQLEAGEPTTRDIITSLLKPGRDPREDLPLPVFRKGILKLEDLEQGMELKGTVLNVVDFGAFVDIGLKDSGLVHISQMANRFIKNPYDVVAVGDIVNVWVLKVDQERRHVSLTMIRPGSERPQQERQAPQGEDRGARRGNRREGPQSGGGGRPMRRSGPPERARQPGGHHPQGAPERSNQGQGQGQGDRQGGAQPRRLPPRRPRKEPPRPNLSKAALEGKEPLRTFGELSALFAAKQDPKPSHSGREDRSQAREKIATEEKPIASAPEPSPAPVEAQESQSSPPNGPETAQVRPANEETSQDNQHQEPGNSQTDTSEVVSQHTGESDHHQ